MNGAAIVAGSAWAMPRNTLCHLYSLLFAISTESAPKTNINIYVWNIIIHSDCARCSSHRKRDIVSSLPLCDTAGAHTYSHNWWGLHFSYHSISHTTKTQHNTKLLLWTFLTNFSVVGGMRSCSCSGSRSWLFIGMVNVYAVLIWYRVWTRMGLWP